MVWLSSTAPKVFINIAERIRSHKDFEQKYQNNSDIHTRELAFQAILRDVMSECHRDELELYKLFAKDPAFRTADCPPRTYPLGVCNVSIEFHSDKIES